MELCCRQHQDMCPQGIKCPRQVFQGGSLKNVVTETPQKITTKMKLTNIVPWWIQTRRLGGRESNKGAPKSLHSFKNPSFSVAIFGYHAKVVTFCRPRKCLCLLVELCDLSGKHHSLKLLLSLIHWKFEAVQKDRSHFSQATHSWERMSVTNNLLYLQQVFERYTLKQWSPTFL